MSGIDVRAVGMSVVVLGGGRTRASDPVDPAVGLGDLAGLGETVGPDRPLGTVHARSASDAALAADALRSAFRIDGSGSSGTARGPVVLRRIAHA